MPRHSIPIFLILAILAIAAEAEIAVAPVPPVAPVPQEVRPEAAGKPSPDWIWKSATPTDNEKVFFRREFELPPEVASAVITITCDDWHRLFVNGHEIGSAADWTQPRTYEVLAQLKPGARNVIAVESRNEAGRAGMALRFRATLKDGKKLHVVSDASWLCSSEAPDGWQTPDFIASAWPKVVVVGKIGKPPWQAVTFPETE